MNIKNTFRLNKNLLKIFYLKFISKEIKELKEMKKYLKYLEQNKYSKNTINTYKSILKKYKDVWNDIRLIKKQLFHYIDSPNTIWTHYNVLLSYMKFNKDKRVDNLRKVKLPPIPQKYMPTFSKNYLYKKTEGLDSEKK